jgi:membrane-bound ClpP family serine protease
MDNRIEPNQAVKTRQKSWIRTLIIILIFEKIIQHIFVTLAFYNNWNDIRSSVVVNPDVLMVLGGIVAVLFIVSLWGMLNKRNWVTNLLIGLALFDVVGECVAQGLFTIVITVSFLVATLLLSLTIVYRWQVVKTVG